MESTEPGWIEVSRSFDQRTARRHGLVLQALEIPHGVFPTSDGWRIVAVANQAARAREEIERYERENVGWPPRELPPKSVSQGIHASIAYIGVLVLFYIAQHTGKFDIDWSAHGRADAALIRGDEWWRTITALSLHADLPHVAGNAVFGAAFGIVLAQSLGVGLAWWSFLVTGALGNYVNAWLQSPTHRSIGASTAVFGALGVQVAYEWMRRRELGHRPLRRWSPVIMGIGLLGWLGTGGISVDDPRSIEQALTRVDIGAHAAGFIVGGGFGLLLGLRRTPWKFTLVKQVLLTALVPAVLVGAWMIALRR